jgi:glycosyltransferase involved in cell wall biosynthesis
MRVLHIMPDLNPGGAELMMKRLIEAHLGDPGYEHRVISLRGLGTVGPRLQALGVSVEALDLTSMLRLPATVLQLARRIRTARPDIVQTWMYHSDLIGGLAARLAGVRRILWGVRVADISPDMGVARNTFWIRRACARLSRHIPSRIVYVCHSARPPHEALGYDPAKGMVIPNGYVVPPGRGDPEEQPLRRALGLPRGALLIGSAGRNSPQKDYPGFVAAAAAISAQVPEAHFVVMGRQLDWDNAELAGLVRQSGHADRFHLLGERPDIGDCLAALDIFCLHSIQEGFPNVVAEAMAVAIPCVVTDVGDAALLVGDTGIVIEPRQPEQLAAALQGLIAAGPDRRRALGRQARRRIEEHFSIAAVAEQFAGLYRDLMRS